MSRLIDADVLKKDINKVSTHWLNEWSTLGVMAMVDKQPTVDAVEVVRCRDCKYWEHDVIFVNGFCRTMRNGEPNWYCADGERREEENK